MGTYNLDEIMKRIEASKEIRDSFTRQPCLLCGNNCKVSLIEQFRVRNSLCESREQMYRKKEDSNDLLHDLKDLQTEIGALLLASNILVYNMTYDAMKDKIDEIIKKVEDKLYEKK